MEGLSPMQNYEIKYLKNLELHENLKTLAARERKLTHVILLHIMEVDRRKFYLERAYPSLWAYLVEGIGCSASAAQRRIDAARLMVQVPSLGQKLEEGSVNLSQVSSLQKNLRQAQKKSPDGSKVRITPEEKQILVEKLENKSSKETELLLAQTFGEPIKQQEFQKIQKDESTRLEMTFSKLEMEILEEAKSYLSHALSRAGHDFSLKAMFLYCARKVIQQKTGRKVA